jgi:predicted enzyme related to lactoylglutathione lyase
MAIKRIQNAYFVAADMDATVAFYRAIGLALKFQDGARWAQFDVAGANFSLASAQEAPPDTTGGVVVFEVDDIEATAAQVTAAGGTILARRDMGAHGRALTFRDPAGNVLQLFQRPPARTDGVS